MARVGPRREERGGGLLRAAPHTVTHHRRGEIASTPNARKCAWPWTFARFCALLAAASRPTRSQDAVAPARRREDAATKARRARARARA